MNEQIIFGFQDQWQEFQVRNELFLAKFPNLKAAFDSAFLITLNISDPLERVVFTMGRLCIEDFFEITLLAGNGYGFGALKLVRGLYERAVTLTYLSDHPEEVNAFLDFFYVTQYKLITAVTNSYGSEVSSPEINQEAKTNYESVKKKYLVTDCEKCGTTKANHTWNKLDFVSMAKKTGALGKLLVPAYYLPLSHAHSTVTSFITRLEETPSGAVGFKPDPQPKEADQALRLAHNIILGILDLQNKHFKHANLEENIKGCFEDFREIWSMG